MEFCQGLCSAQHGLLLHFQVSVRNGEPSLIGSLCVLEAEQYWEYVVD